MQIDDFVSILFILRLVARLVFFVCASVASYVTFVLSLFVPQILLLFVPRGGCAS